MNHSERLCARAYYHRYPDNPNLITLNKWIILTIKEMRQEIRNRIVFNYMLLWLGCHLPPNCNLMYCNIFTLFLAAAWWATVRCFPSFNDKRELSPWYNLTNSSKLPASAACYTARELYKWEIIIKMIIELIYCIVFN